MKGPVGNTSRGNNFDLIRLVAALQVVWYHGMKYLGPAAEHKGAFLSMLDTVSTFFPGVPIFFFLSGYLVTMSYERSPSVGQYALNRAIRLYPALWTCLFVSLGTIFAMGGLEEVAIGGQKFLSWMAAQMTIFQFYNSSILPGYGSGVPNGALWTISVELQFYALVPLVFLVLGKPTAAQNRWKWLAFALVMFGVAQWLAPNLQTPSSTGWLMVKVSALPYLYSFVLGAVVRAFLPQLRWAFDNKLGIWVLLHAAICMLVLYADAAPSVNANTPHPATIITLAGVTFSAAWTLPGFSSRLLRSQDISYGIYIYHMVIINLLLEAGVRGLGAVFLTALLAILCGTLSWVLVEKRALRLKPYSVRPSRESAKGDGIDSGVSP